MALTASGLSKSGARGHDIETFVRDQLAVIDEKLQRHERSWGRNVLKYDLPISFSLPGLAKADAQLVIYSSIIQSLEKRGFETRILIEQDLVQLAIAWETVFSEGEVDAMTRVVSNVRVDRKTLDAFCKRGVKKSQPGEGKSSSQHRQMNGESVPRSSAAASTRRQSELPSWAAGSGASPPPPARAES